MRTAMRRVGAVAAAGIVAISGITSAAPAASATPLFCDTNDQYWYFTVTADWLLVHTSAGTSTPAVGQVPHGSVFCARAGGTYIKIVNGVSFRYGYGHNGSTKLTGWVDASYLS